jgi:hypothetical protein
VLHPCIFLLESLGMESVVFDGKEFIKASVLAEKFRYTQDYLGQLCRGKKVDARLVGRAWYINLDSLNSHRTARYKAVGKSEAVVIKKPSNHYLSRIDVEPVLKQKTVKIMRGESGKFIELPMKYEGDDYSLIPRVNKSAISSHLHILPADAEKIKVHKDKDVKNITNFKAEPLPEVYLSGTLKVEGIEEVTEETIVEVPEIEETPLEVPKIEETAAEVPPSDGKIPINTVKIRTLRRPVASVAPLARQTPRLLPLKPLVKHTTPLTRTVRLVDTQTKHPPHTFTPTTLTVANPAPVETNPGLLLPAAAVVAGLISGFLILTTEVLIETTPDSYTKNFVIEAENVPQVARVIFSKIH